MRRKLALASVALAIIVAGVAALSAFTAQAVNITAHAEKDIAVEPVICTGPDYGSDYDKPCYLDPAGGSYGTTVPQELYDKEIEVTLSNSFFDQDKFFDLVYDVFWECKQFEDLRDDVNNLTGLPPEDGIPDCLNNYNTSQGHNICKRDLDSPPDGRADRLEHCDPEVLDDNIRDHIAVSAKADPERCQTDVFGPPLPKNGWEAKEIEWQFSGTLNKATAKCRYELKFLSPPCEGSYNPWTDPSGITPKTVECHKADKMRHVSFDDDGDQHEDGTVGSPGDNECYDGSNNDQAKGKDGKDPDCNAGPAVDEDPLDGIDNDGDGLTDEDPGAEAVNPQDIDEFADLGDDFKIQVFEHSLSP